jgi:hypothetical protein
LLQFAPDAGFTPTFPGAGTEPEPLVVTGAITDFETIESELIRVNDADIAEEGAWAINNYALTAPAGLVMTTIRVSGVGNLLIGTTIPTGAFDIVGIAVPYNTAYQIQPRGTEDINLRRRFQAGSSTKRNRLCRLKVESQG